MSVDKSYQNYRDHITRLSVVFNPLRPISKTNTNNCSSGGSGDVSSLCKYFIQ